jgi:hypothetical protein
MPLAMLTEILDRDYHVTDDHDPMCVIIKRKPRAAA